ncbi:MAG: carbohydrate ABC transporter permease [Planctomycetota bacterium]|nr:carbohydrate ABC transporter permease [Planctomycetota bacterium]
MRLVLKACAVLFAFVLFGLPMLWMLVLALKPSAAFAQDPLGIFFTPTLEHYIKVFRQGALVRAMVNSVVATAFSVALTLALATPVAFALSRFSFRGKRALSLLLLLGLTVPIHITLLPLLKGTAMFGLSSTLFALGVVYASFGLAITIFMLKNAFDSMPGELLEAATLDGCSNTRALFSVALPVIRPTIVVAAVYNCVINYNEFAFALTLLRTERLKTLPLFIADFSKAMDADVQAQAAAISLAAIPVFVLFVFAQKYMIAGMTEGALKG